MLFHYLKKAATALIVILCISLCSCHDPVPIEKTIAFAQRTAIWQSFRSYFLHNIQTIAASDESDGSHVVIVSEPPGWLTLKDVDKFLGSYNARYEIKQNNIGHDGWVKDILICVNDLDTTRFHEFICKLNKLVYRSDYKPYAVSLPLGGDQKTLDPYLEESVNSNISASELKSWFTEQNEHFALQGGNGNYTVHDICSNSRSGVFYSTKPGFVMWALNVNKDISNSIEEIRQFALDADLIIGAISENNTLCIIGRERTENVCNLPPLRTETVLLLASADKEQISQSYERMSYFAGKLPGGVDWAPAYLSPDLKNTEYGSLLGITDQMLKSWSENGKVSYKGFSYPAPDHWAFDNGIMKDLKADEVTYNWNTIASVYRVEDNGADYVAIDKIGALPVTYIPEGQEKNARISVFESRGHDFFAELNNRDLIRANQYAILYQLFKHYNITASSPASDNIDETTAPAAPAGLQTTPVTAEIEHALDNIYSLSDDDIVAQSKKIARKTAGMDSSRKRTAYEYYKAKNPDITWKEFNELMEFQILLEAPNVAVKLDSIRTLLHDYKDYNIGGFDKIAAVMGNPRDFTPVTDVDTVLAYISLDLQPYQKIIEAATEKSIEQIQEEYNQNFAGDTTQWIKTSAVVQSWQADSGILEGGHNIKARMSPVEVDATIARGEIRVTEELDGSVIHVNPADADRITPELIKKAENKLISGNVSLGGGDIPPPRPPRARETVIASSGHDGRGFVPAIHVERKTAGFAVNGKEMKDCHSVADEVAALMAQHKDQGVEVVFTQMTEDESRAIVKSTQTKNLVTEGHFTGSGDFFHIADDIYDFERMSVTAQQTDIKIVIPARENPKLMRKAIMTVSDVKPSMMQRVVNAVNNLKRRYLSGEAKAGFASDLRKELEQYGVQRSSIRVAVQDNYLTININPDYFNHDEDAAGAHAA